ncbi:MAG: hypothetical protein MMC23_004199 [Stictis urceolatum]|nr:hypothetical protein [Stictis urceolata]
MKYYPENEPSVRRNLEIHDKLATSPPNAVKKMGDDAGEMFFLEYWGFEEEEQSDKQRRISGNATMFGPAIRIHGDLSIAPRSYYKRDFTCPTAGWATLAAAGIATAVAAKVALVLKTTYRVLLRMVEVAAFQATNVKA